MILTCYAFVALLSLVDEVWNVNNPRPEPKGKYHVIVWEKKDFYSFQVQGEWVLRKKRKTDSPLKKRIRAKYWKKRLGK
jgi:hypothetical protein